MTELERVEALLKHEKPDRVPIWPFASLGFASIYNNLSIYDAYANPEASYYAQRKTCRDFGWVFVPYIGYAAIGAWEFGGEVRMPSGEYDQAPTVTRYPIEKDEDIYDLKWPGPDSGFYPIAAKFTEIARKERLDNEPFNAYINSGAGYGLSCNIVGLDRFLRWLIKKPDLAHYLIRILSDWGTERLIKRNKILGTKGVLATSSGGPTSSNYLISPRQFEEFVLPTVKEGEKQLRDLGYKTTYIHICGEHNDNLPYWSQIDFGDPGIISIGHEIKLETAAKYFPDDIILGNLDTSIIQTGTPREVYDATRIVVEQGKQLPGYIFSPGCDLPPKSPVENVRMMTKAVDDFGWY
jgi:uroporphyrinogen decarboxylase